MTTLKSDKITTSGNWACPANVSLAWVTLVGAGGGGGGNTTAVASFNDVVDDDFGDSSLNAAWTTGYQTDGGAVEGAGNVVITAGQGVWSNAACQPSGFYQNVDAGDFDISFTIIDTTLTNITTTGVGVIMGFWLSANVYGCIRTANVSSGNFTRHDFYYNNNGSTGSAGSTTPYAITGTKLRLLRAGVLLYFLIKSVVGVEWESLGTWTCGTGAGRVWISVNKAAGDAFTATIDWFGDYPVQRGQGSGGGGGETIYRLPVNVVANNNYKVTIGTGGGGGTGTDGAGTDGGNTYFANDSNAILLTAAGGWGGYATETGRTVSIGGKGGGVQATTPGAASSIYIPYGGTGAGGGNNGSNGGIAGSFNGGARGGSTDEGGGGGASMFGEGGGGGNNTGGDPSADGNTPSNYGGGGGGGGWNGNGGNGANGLAIIEYFG